LVVESEVFNRIGITVPAGTVEYAEAGIAANSNPNAKMLDDFMAEYP